jgi:2-dehydro-3-deoxyphosphooctonate aldolase (KDO 8-P synthase)
MKNVIDKARAAAKEKGLPEDSFMACERGVSFGYNNLVSDMRSLAIMRERTHRSCSTPPTRCSCRAARAPPRAASASSCRCWPGPRSRSASPGVFMETHPDPAKALSDGPNAVPLKHMKALLEQLVALDRVTKSQRLLENEFAAY